MDRHQLGIDAAALLCGILVGLLDAGLDLRQARGDRHQVLDLQILAILVGQQPRMLLLQPRPGQCGVGHLLREVLGARTARLQRAALAGHGDQRLSPLGRDTHLDLTTGLLATALVDLQHRAVAERRALAGLCDLPDAGRDLRRVQLYLHVMLVGKERAFRRSNGGVGRTGACFRRPLATLGAGSQRQQQHRHRRGPRHHRQRGQVHLRHAAHVHRHHRRAGTRIHRFAVGRDAAFAARGVVAVGLGEVVGGPVGRGGGQLERLARGEPQQAAAAPAHRAVAVDDIADRRFGLHGECDPAAMAASLVFHVLRSAGESLSAPMVILWHGDKAASAAYARGLTLYRNADAPASPCPRPGRRPGRLPAGRRPDHRFHPGRQPAGRGRRRRCRLRRSVQARPGHLDAAVAGQRHPDRRPPLRQRAG
ncbi:hypothetical protein G6F65_014813 [Rhizopus arrhizus]|nr:hypothetical protein G6F65_014813 [Rhizopus arrhizus]